MGGLPCRALSGYTTNLNIIRYLTGSQCKSFITGEMWSKRVVLERSLWGSILNLLQLDNNYNWLVSCKVDCLNIKSCQLTSWTLKAIHDYPYNSKMKGSLCKEMYNRWWCLNEVSRRFMLLLFFGLSSKFYFFSITYLWMAIGIVCWCLKSGCFSLRTLLVIWPHELNCCFQDLRVLWHLSLIFHPLYFMGHDCVNKSFNLKIHARKFRNLELR